MASKLKAVAPKTTEPSKPKILIYGKPGVGKTWASLDFPACYYVDTEGGAKQKQYTDKLEKSGGVYFGPEQGSLDFGTVIEQVQALATEKHPYKTLIIDSISKLFNHAISVEAEKLGDKDAFGASKKPAVAHMRRLVNWLSRLDMNVVLISHEKAEWGLDAKGQRVEIGSTFDCYDKLEYELDLCLGIVKTGPVRTARVRKSRLESFPDAKSFPWSYEEFAKLYGQDIIEKQSTQIVLATPEQLGEVNRLLSIVKLPDGQVEKWLTAYQVDSWSELSQETVDKVIKGIKEKYLNTETKGE